MESKSCCIVGACQNVAGYLPQVLANMNTIASWWRECKIVIYENDSTDDTPRILLEWKNEGGHRELVQETGLAARYPGRTDRLAYIRNRLLHYVPPQFDYMFMVDMDDVFTKPVRKESFEACFQLKSWDVMTANTDWYYDIWALRVPGMIDFDCWKRYYELLRAGYSTKDATWTAIEQYKERMSKLNQIVIVHSAFNAGALYKVSAIRTCCKFVGHVNGNEICEHVPFQACLRSHGARILFHPEFKL